LLIRAPKKLQTKRKFKIHLLEQNLLVGILYELLLFLVLATLIGAAGAVSPNKRKILLKTLEQLHIDNLALMSSCIEFAICTF